MTIKITDADIVTAFDGKGVIGSKVTNFEGFQKAVLKAVEAHDFTEGDIPGQAFIMVPEAAPFVSAGAGKKSTSPEDFVLREHRGQVNAYLRREHAAPTEGCAVVMYTLEAYLDDPDVDEAEATRIKAEADVREPVGVPVTHVLVAVLAFAGPSSPLDPWRFVHNLAGGNKEALVWGGDTIREKAKEIRDYWGEWAIVADPPA